MPHMSPMSWMTVSTMSHMLLWMIMSNAHLTYKNKSTRNNVFPTHTNKQMKWKW